MTCTSTVAKTHIVTMATTIRAPTIYYWLLHLCGSYYAAVAPTESSNVCARVKIEFSCTITFRKKFVCADASTLLPILDKQPTDYSSYTRIFECTEITLPPASASALQLRLRHAHTHANTSTNTICMCQMHYCFGIRLWSLYRQEHTWENFYERGKKIKIYIYVKLKERK